MQAIFINTPAINQCDQLERKRELTEKLHEIIKAERENFEIAIRSCIAHELSTDLHSVLLFISVNNEYHLAHPRQ